MFRSARDTGTARKLTARSVGRWGARTEFKRRVPSQEAAMREGRGLNWGPIPL